MGFGKAFKKAWKKTFGWADDALKYTPAGMLIDSVKGMNESIENAYRAQVASSEKLAKMQQATVVSAAPPQQTTENQELTEENNATKKARAFRLANSVRSDTLGGGSSSSNKKRTLG